MKLWLQRHAKVIAEPGLCYGALDLDAWPDATRKAAARLAAELPAGVALWHSPLRRCAKLARELAALRPDLRPRADPRIAEMDFGGWEGRPWADVPRADFDAWTAAFADHRPGAHGESVRTFMARVTQARADWLATGADAAWITHAGVMRAVQLVGRGQLCCERAEDWPLEGPAFGGLVVHPAAP